jgi:hypothetical protein
MRVSSSSSSQAWRDLASRPARAIAAIPATSSFVALRIISMLAFSKHKPQRGDRPRAQQPTLFSGNFTGCGRLRQNEC